MCAFVDVLIEATMSRIGAGGYVLREFSEV